MAAGECRACDEPKEKGNPYCKRHKSAHQALERHAKKKDKDGKHARPEQAEAFDTIFGKGRDPPPNMTLANQVILKFDNQFPTNAGQGKNTSKREVMDLTEFSHSRGSYQNSAEIDEEIVGMRNCSAHNSIFCEDGPNNLPLLIGRIYMTRQELLMTLAGPVELHAPSFLPISWAGPSRGSRKVSEKNAK